MLSTGAREVVVTDREPLALECALRSAAASGVANVAEMQNSSNGLPSSGAQASTSSCNHKQRLLCYHAGRISPFCRCCA